jgi:hypothetical protein
MVACTCLIHRRWRFESSRSDQTSVAQSAECRVHIAEVAGSLPAAGTTRPCSPIGRGGSFKHCLVQVRTLPGVCALVAQSAEAAALNTVECWFESSRGHVVAVAQGARAPLWYSGDPGATSGSGSIHLWRRSLRAGLKHRRCRCDTCQMDHLEGQADWRRPPPRKRASASLGRSTRPPSANSLSLAQAHVA